MSRIITFLFLLTSGFAFCQGEFIIEINPETGVFTKNTEVYHGVGYSVLTNESSFVESQHRYMLRTGGEQVVSTDVVNHAVTNYPIMGILNGLEYDDTTGTYYSIKYISPNEKFVSVNFATGIATPIGNADIGGYVTQGDFYAFDKINHKYFFFVQPNILRVIDASSGVPNLVGVMKPVGSTINNISFDNSTGNLYGICFTPGDSKLHLVKIDPTTGSVYLLGNGISASNLDGTGTIDEANQQYIHLYGMGENLFLLRYNLVDGSTAGIAPLSPLSENDNVHGLEFDNIQGKLYAMHWDDLIELNTNIHYNRNFTGIYPNPITDFGTLDLPQSIAGTYYLKIFNALGAMVENQQVSTNTSTSIKIERNNLPQGMYFYDLTLEGKSIDRGKFIIR